MRELHVPAHVHQHAYAHVRVTVNLEINSAEWTLFALINFALMSPTIRRPHRVAEIPT